MEEVVGVGVLGELTGHRADHRQLVGHRADVREEITDRQAARPVRLELPQAGENRADVVELRLVDLKPGILLEPRLRVEAVDLGHAAVHVEEDDVLRRCGVVVDRRHRIGSGRFGVEEGRRRHPSESARRLGEKSAARERSGTVAPAVVTGAAAGRIAAHGIKMNSLALTSAWARSAHAAESR